MEYPSDFTEDLRKKPICGVIAVAIIARVSYARATEVIKNNLMFFQKRHGGRTHDEQVVNALKELGVECVPVSFEKANLLNWVKKQAMFGHMYLVRTGQHFVVVTGETVADQYGIVPVEQCLAKRCFPKQIWEIV